MYNIAVQLMSILETPIWRGLHSMQQERNVASKLPGANLEQRSSDDVKVTVLGQLSDTV